MHIDELQEHLEALLDIRPAARDERDAVMRRASRYRRHTIARRSLGSAIGAVMLVVGTNAVVSNQHHGMVAVRVQVPSQSKTQTTYVVPSESMKPMLTKNERVVVNTSWYDQHGIERGDIIVFTTPASERSDIKELIKRVVALPGETIETRNDEIYITQVGQSEARILDEPYVNQDCKKSGAPYNNDLAKQTIPPDKYFVMGDNRCLSHDSRFFGPIKKSSVIGRVNALHKDRVPSATTNAIPTEVTKR